MKTYIHFVTYMSETIGRTFGWAVIVLTMGTCWEVFKRYVLNDPTDWAFDMSYILYGVLFLMSGAYALAQDAHVRGDFLYRKWHPRTQAKVDLALYFLFFFPGVLALIFSGFFYGLDATRIQEVSVNSPVGVPIWPLKMIIFVAGLTLFFQGVAEVFRCILCIQNGAWPERDEDVRELETQLRDEFSSETEEPAR